jgi:hypothetical protein
LAEFLATFKCRKNSAKISTCQFLVTSIYSFQLVRSTTCRNVEPPSIPACCSHMTSRRPLNSFPLPSYVRYSTVPTLTPLPFRGCADLKFLCLCDMRANRRRLVLSYLPPIKFSVLRWNLKIFVAVEVLCRTETEPMTPCGHQQAKFLVT